MRTLMIGGEVRGRDIGESFEYSSPYRYCLCNGGTRVAVWMRDEEHDWRHLILADAETGTVIEHFQDIAPEYGGSIELCRDGVRIVYQDRQDDRTWCYRDETPDAWLDLGPVATGFDSEDDDTEDDVDVSVFCRLAASADGTTVVMVATREEERRRRTTRTARAQVWSLAEGVEEPTLREVEFGEGVVPPEPQVAVSGGAAPLVAFEGNGRLVVCDASTGEIRKELKLPWKSREDARFRGGAVQFSDDGRRLIAFDGVRFLAWETADWSEIRVTLSPPDVHAVAVSPDGRTVAAVDAKGVVRFFDAATGAPGPAIQPPRPDDSYATPAGLSFSADGAMCLLGYSNGFVAIWDAE